MSGPRWSVTLGVALGVLPFAVLLLIDLTREQTPESAYYGWPGDVLFFGSYLVTPAVVLAGAVLAIFRKTRRFGVSLLVSGLVTAAVALCVASKIMPSIAALRF